MKRPGIRKIFREPTPIISFDGPEGGTFCFNDPSILPVRNKRGEGRERRGSSTNASAGGGGKRTKIKHKTLFLRLDDEPR